MSQSRYSYCDEIKNTLYHFQCFNFVYAGVTVGGGISLLNWNLFVLNQYVQRLFFFSSIEITPAPRKRRRIKRIKLHFCVCSSIFLIIVLLCSSKCVCFYFNLINFSFLHSHAYSISIRSVLSFSGLQCCNRINVAFHRFAWGDRSTTKHHHSKSQMFAIFLLHFSSPFWFW